MSLDGLTPLFGPALMPVNGRLPVDPTLLAGLRFDVSSYDYVLIRLRVVGGPNMGVQLIPSFFDESRNLAEAGGNAAPVMPTPMVIHTFLAAAGVSDQLYALRCTGPRFQIDANPNGAGLNQIATLTLWGSNRGYTHDGPYTPSFQGAYLLQGVALAQGGQTFMPPYAGPALLAVGWGALGDLVVVEATDYIGTTFSPVTSLYLSNSNAGDGLGRVASPFWCPPRPIRVTSALGTSAVSIIAA